jgi:hypothetical protein
MMGAILIASGLVPKLMSSFTVWHSRGKFEKAKTLPPYENEAKRPLAHQISKVRETSLPKEPAAFVCIALVIMKLENSNLSSLQQFSIVLKKE